MIGFRFAQTMRGSYHLLDSPTDERAFEITMLTCVPGLRQLAHDPSARVVGRLHAEKLAEHSEVSGTLGLQIRKDRRLPYDLEFTGDDGRPYRFRGQQPLMLLALAESLTTLTGSLYDEGGKEIGRAILRFDYRSDLGTAMRSLRPTFG